MSNISCTPINPNHLLHFSYTCRHIIDHFTMQKTNHSPSRHVYLDITMNIVRLSTAIFVEMIRDSGRIPQIGLVHVIVGQQLPQLLVRYTR